MEASQIQFAQNCELTPSRQCMWVARNLKYYPLALRSAVDEGMLGFVGDGLKVTPAGPADTQPKS
jgi:hypothetical protein